MPDSTQSDSSLWIARIVEDGKPYEIALCMQDLLDRAEFAEEMARRNLLERLAKAVEAWDSTLSSYCDGPERDECRAVVAELGRLRMGHV